MSLKYPKDLQSLIIFLKKLPGVGAKTAERFSFELLKWPELLLKELSELLERIKRSVEPCKICGCLTHEGNCSFCNSQDRDFESICVTSSPKDVYAIESTKCYKGLYHVIDHLLSPLDNRYPESLHLERLRKRIEDHSIREVILAFDSTLEGDATALFLKKHCKLWKVKATRLAFGLPIGSSLEYIDEGTLSRAMIGRQCF